ncbi:MAG: hypothetical protein ACJZ48_04420 [Candidatus Pelagibacterales bacterium]
MNITLKMLALFLICLHQNLTILMKKF